MPKLATKPNPFAVEAKHVSVAYGERVVLHDITTNIKRAAVTCVCGGSGCGKSTFLRSIIGLTPTKKGTIQVLGELLSDLEGDARDQFLARVGFMYQNSGLINSLTILENLKIPLIAHTQLPANVIDELARYKLEQVQLSHAVNLLPGELSGGMLKRAGFARAIVLEPELVLSDEPSAGLDPVTAADLDELMTRLVSELGMTLIVVTHDLDSIKRIADHVVMLDKGYVILDDTLQTALASNDPFVKTFFERQAHETQASANALLNTSFK